MAKHRDKAGITDEVVIELNVDHPPDPDAKGPAEFYMQTLADGSQRVVDRFGNDHGATIPTDVVVQVEAHPGQYGGPVPPEGEPK